MIRVLSKNCLFVILCMVLPGLLSAQTKTSTSASTKNSKQTDKLINAALLGRTEVVSKLIKEGANPNIRGRYGMTPLLYAVDNRTSDTVKLLLKHGADPNLKSTDGETALIIASNHRAQKNNQKVVLRIIDLLLAHKADVNAQDSRGNTALIDAVQWENTSVVRALIQHGANPYIHNNVGFNSFDILKKRQEYYKNKSRFNSNLKSVSDIVKLLKK